ncbi:hypothetical protein [Streptomyces sp. cg2]|uniref:hypothetical protein n=1 Tax=Streptomyces sp. cg2 TaxID=3238799 RepID=UPI0034E2CBFA
MLHLPEFVASLPAESPLREKYGEPAEFRMQWLLPVCVGVLGAVTLVSGSLAAGIVLVLGSVGLGFWLSRRASASMDARAVWSRSLYCRRCPARFLPEEALAGRS